MSVPGYQHAKIFPICRLDPLTTQSLTTHVIVDEIRSKISKVNWQH